MKRLLILAVTLSLMGTGQALCQTIHAATTIQDTGNASNGSSPATVPVSSTGAILTTAQQYLGYPYAYIGDDPSIGFSCIGFAHYVFAQSGIYVPEDLGKAYGSAPHVDESNLQPGDLVFFQNTVWDGISHVALYVGGGKMIAADSFQTGVQWNNIDDSYWPDHYLGATRPLSNPTGTPLNPSTAPLASGVPLGPAEMAHFSRKIIGCAGHFGPIKPSVRHGTRRSASLWVGLGVHAEDFSSISAGPNGTGKRATQ